MIDSSPIFIYTIPYFIEIDEESLKNTFHHCLCRRQKYAEWRYYGNKTAQFIRKDRRDAEFQ